MADLLGSALVQLRSALRLSEKDGSDLVSVPLSVAEIKALLDLHSPAETRAFNSTGLQEASTFAAKDSAQMVRALGEPGAITANGTSAARDVLAERRRQIGAEGWVPEHDDQHTDGSMAMAAAAYASGDPALWPWGHNWWKPKDRRRDLVRAGALIIAEIERLDRLSPLEGSPSEDDGPV